MKEKIHLVDISGLSKTKSHSMMREIWSIVKKYHPDSTHAIIPYYGLQHFIDRGKTKYMKLEKE